MFIQPTKIYLSIYLCICVPSSEETDGDEDTEGDVEEVQGHSTQERTIGPEDYTHFQVPDNDSN